MEKHYKEKHLQATIYKIENVKREQNFLLQHIWKVIGFGILFSIWAPTYMPENAFRQKSESLINRNTEYSYIRLVLISAIVFVVLCLLYHFSAKYQDNRKLKKLNTLKSKLEKEIAEL